MLALNRRFAVETSELDAARLRSMLSTSFATLAAGDGGAFLIAFDQSSTYDSANFIWFKTRYARFVYVDRVVVAPALQGRGVARALYRRVADLALQDGHTRLACEVNVEPPNPASAHLHAALGFVEVERAGVASDKIVARLMRSLEGFSPVAIAPRS